MNIFLNYIGNLFWSKVKNNFKYIYYPNSIRNAVGKSGELSDFWGEITNFNKKTKKWHVHFFESDCESEDLTIDEVLSSLRDSE